MYARETKAMLANTKTHSSRIVLVISRDLIASFTHSCSRTTLLLCTIFIALSGCAKHKQASVSVKPPKRSFQAPVEPARIGTKEKGEASWYGEPYNGRRAASGEIFDMEQLTAAHRTFPFQTWVEVTNLDNGKKVEVRITDRGPFVDGRVIDLSRAAAREIDLLRSGIAKVELRVIEGPTMVAAIREPAREPINLPEAPSDPTPSPSGEFVVQAGAFASRDRAEALASSLLIVGEARLVPNSADPPLWRVWIGKNLTLDLAQRLAEQVKAVSGQAVVVRGR